MRAFLIGSILIGVYFATPSVADAAKLEAGAVKAWDSYVQLTEKRIEAELTSTSGFLRTDFLPQGEASRITGVLNNGGAYIEKMNTRLADGREVSVPGGMIHHWFGSIYIPGTGSQALLNWVQDYDHHYRYFEEVEQSRLLSHEGDTFNIFLRFVRKKVVTVHYNTNHTAVYRHHRDGLESSRSFTTRIAEVQNAGSISETEKPVGDDSGFLWRLNSYWRFKQQADGVIVECESISLSRSIPFGLGWLIKSFVESVPRESLENTLVSIGNRVTK